MRAQGSPDDADARGEPLDDAGDRAEGADGDGREETADADPDDGEAAGETDPDDWEEVGEAAAPVRPPRPHRPAPRPPQTLGVRCARCPALLPTGLAVCPSCLAPVAARERGGGAGRAAGRIAGGALRLVLRGGAGHLDVPRGAVLHLGRSGGWAPEAAGLLADEPSVSARHATVEHTADGAAWVTEVPQGATNGTRVNELVLRPGSRFRLRNGDRVGLGPWVDFVVHGVAREPGEAGD
ncbi:FHA domain-containing protein [Streptomyces seoulensis]